MTIDQLAKVSRTCPCVRMVTMPRPGVLNSIGNTLQVPDGETVAVSPSKVRSAMSIDSAWSAQPSANALACSFASVPKTLKRACQPEKLSFTTMTKSIAETTIVAMSAM